MSFLCGGDDRDLPDAGQGMCCDGAAMMSHCTCWRPVYDTDQQPPRTGEVGDAQPVMCGDCAFRPGSPERAGDDRVAGDADLLEDLVALGRPFYCHAGMRRVLALEHPPSGARVERADDYAPPIVDGRPYQADGSPALLCGGWVARRLAFVQRELPEATG